MSLSDFEKLAGEVSVAVQKYRYIQSARVMSFMMPGLGQFRTGDAVGGSLFLAGHLAVVAGTLAGAYFLLPSNVQFGALDYFNTPLATISNIWESNTVLQYLPSFGVMAGGMILDQLLGLAASANAAAEAKDAVASGKVTFQPEIVAMPGGGLGMGMMMRMGK